MNIEGMKLKRLINSLVFFILTITTKAQDTSGLSELEGKLNSGVLNTILGVGGTVLAVYLIGIVWKLATGKPEGKDHVIKWFVGVAFLIILYAIFR